MAVRYWPLEQGRIVTSPFGPRAGEWHTGVDFGFPGGSAGRKVYAIQSGTVQYAGAADGYGGPDPAGWLVIDSDDSQGGGVFEYGHIVRLPSVTIGSTVRAGQQIAVINPNSNSNGGTAPHLHLSWMPGSYDPNTKSDPLPILAGSLEVGKEMSVGRPDFNEYPVWSASAQQRGGAKIDLFLLHTQEGPGNADSLAQFLGNPANQVSYHYTVSQDPRDHGVTVCDVVDTDLASWSVLSANNRSINLCFAGSSVKWTREQWMAQSKALDAAAWLAVQDCKKYGIPLTVVAPPYTSGKPGISDHAYVTRVLHDGSHSDVGPNFPWLYFSQKVAEYAGTAPAPVTPPKPVTPPTPVKQYPRDYTDRELLEDIWKRVFKLTQP